MDKSFWQKVFPDTRSLVTNALFDKGYRRWHIEVTLANGDEYEAVVWGRDGARLRNYFAAKSTVARVGIEGLPIAPVTENDDIVSDDFLEGWDTTQERSQ